MNIKEQADAIVEKHRPYANYYERDEYGNLQWSTGVGTRNATLCGIKEMEARIEMCDGFNILGLIPKAVFQSVTDELTAILNELKSRI
jgi:hypothetical protein